MCNLVDAEIVGMAVAIGMIGMIGMIVTVTDILPVVALVVTGGTIVATMIAEADTAAMIEVTKATLDTATGAMEEITVGVMVITLEEEEKEATEATEEDTAEITAEITVGRGTAVEDMVTAMEVAVDPMAVVAPLMAVAVLLMVVTAVAVVVLMAVVAVLTIVAVLTVAAARMGMKTAKEVEEGDMVALTTVQVVALVAMAAVMIVMTTGEREEAGPPVVVIAVVDHPIVAPDLVGLTTPTSDERIQIWVSVVA